MLLVQNKNRITFAAISLSGQNVIMTFSSEVIGDKLYPKTLISNHYDFINKTNFKLTASGSTPEGQTFEVYNTENGFELIKLYPNFFNRSKVAFAVSDYV